jgi:hypothetical protein
MCDAKRRSEQSLSSRRPKRNNQLRVDGLNFRIEPRAAGVDLLHGWLFVDAHFAARFPLEVLHRVRDVDLATIDLSLFQRLVEQLARRAHKGTALLVLLVAWLLSDHHDGNAGMGGVIVGLQFTEDSLGRVSIQIAALALLHCLGQHRQLPLVRHKGRGTFLRLHGDASTPIPSLGCSHALSSRVLLEPSTPHVPRPYVPSLYAFLTSPTVRF